MVSQWWVGWLFLSLLLSLFLREKSAILPPKKVFTGCEFTYQGQCGRPHQYVNHIPRAVWVHLSSELQILRIRLANICDVELQILANLRIQGQWSLSQALTRYHSRTVGGIHCPTGRPDGSRCDPMDLAVSQRIFLNTRCISLTDPVDLSKPDRITCQSTTQWSAALSMQSNVTLHCRLGWAVSKTLLRFLRSNTSNILRKPGSDLFFNFSETTNIFLKTSPEIQNQV